jgi:hypothetical protein
MVHRLCGNEQITAIRCREIQTPAELELANSVAKEVAIGPSLANHLRVEARRQIEYHRLVGNFFYTNHNGNGGDV